MLKHKQFIGMIFRRKLLRNFFDAIDWANLNAQTAEGATPVIDVIIVTVGNNGVFRTDQLAGIA